MARSDRFFLAFFVGLAALFAVQLHGPIDARWDGAVYYILGTSLAEGHGYRLLNEPGDIEAVQYPPLLPLIVAGAQRALGTSDFVVVGTALRWIYAVMSLALAALTYLLARRHLSPARAFLASAVAGLAVHVWYLAGVLYAEIPYSLVAVAFVLCARRADRAGYWLATAALGAAAYLLRTAGLALLLGWVAEAVLRADGRSLGSRVRQVAARIAVVLVPVLAWQVWVGSVTSSAAYRHPAYPYQRAPYQYSNVPYAENMRLANPFAPEEGLITPGARIAMVARNVALAPASIGGAVTAQRAFWEMTIYAVNRRILGGDVLPLSAALLPMSLLGMVIIAGGVVLLRRGERLIPLVCAAATASICLTPWPEQFVRYLTPVTPFLSIMLVLGIGLLWDRPAIAGRSRWAPRAAAAAVLGLVFAQDAMVAAWTFLIQGARPVPFEDAGGRRVTGRMLFYDEPIAAVDQALLELRHRARPGDVIATSQPHWAFVRTGAKAVLPPMVTDRDEARRLLDAVPVRFVVVDELGHPGISQRYAAPAVAEAPGWHEVYRTDDGLARVYERRR
jgi:hypothetical protein